MSPPRTCSRSEARLSQPAAVPAQNPHVARHVVSIVASIGGLAALRRLLSGLPAGLPASVLVVMHLERGRESRLAELLGPGSALPVREARGGERLAEGVVYVAPPDRHPLAAASGTRFLSHAPPEHRSRPSGDLFRSVAERYGSRAVAVVLTGRLGDGRGGVDHVHAAGGTVAQDPAAAAAGSMPLASIHTRVVDRVLPLDEIAPALRALVGAA